MLPKFSVKKPFTIMVGVIMIIVLGYISFTTMKTDLLPKMDLPYAIIMTTYVGASPEKVETTVTKPIEQIVSTVNNVKNVNSVSSENSSMIIIEFTDNVNMDSALIELNNNLDLIKGNLPDNVGSPTILKLNPDMMPVIVAAIDIDNKSIEEISTYVTDEIIPKLEKTNGVGSLSANGIVEEKVQVVLNQDKINSINNKVLEHVDSELSKTQSDLKKAKAQIEKGKSELEKQSKEQTSKLVDGITALKQGKEQINTSQKELANKEKQLTTLKNILEETIKRYDDQSEKLKTKINESLDNAGLNITEQNSLNEANNALNIIKENREKCIAKLNELEEDILQISNNKNLLNAKKLELDEQEKQFEIAKVTLTTELSKAKSSLATSEAELAKGEQEFKNAREQAYKNASIADVITQSMISNILSAENFEMPAGTINNVNNKISVKVGEKFTSIDEIKNLTLFSFDIEGLENVTLEQLADISFTNNKNELYAKINGNDAVLLIFQKQSTSSTTDVSNDIKETMSNIENDNKNIHFTVLMDQGIYINIVIGSVLENLLYGGILAIIILFLFLHDFRPTLIVALSIPISVTFAIALMYFTGVTINIMSLSGLALGVGMLVDNSIVVIENIYRLKNKGLSVKEAAIQGAGRVAGAIFASTLTTICVFLPIVFVQGVTKQLFKDMGLTIAYSLLASLIVALTLVPAMASTVFKNANEKKHKFFDIFSELYKGLLKIALKLKPLVLIFAIVILVLSGFWASKMGTDFIPETDSTQMSLTLTMPKGTKYNELKDKSNYVVERLLTIDDIKTIGAIGSGSSEMVAMQSSSTNSINMYIILKDDKNLSNIEIKNKIMDLTKDLNCEIDVSTSNMDLSSMSGSGMEVIIKGNDIPTLQNIANDIANLMNQTEGLTQIDNGIADTEKELKVVVNKNLAMKYGLTVATVYQSITGSIQNEITSTQLSLNSKDYPIVVVKSEQNKITEDNLSNIELDGKENQEDVKVKLSDIATIEKVDTLSSISRTNNQRYITVASDVDSEHNIGIVSRDFEGKLKSYEVPNGYSVEIEGESETINNTIVDLIKMIGLAVLFVYLIMVAQFQSLLAPFIIMFTIPLAFTGGLLALGITETEISIISMIGFLVLSGIVVNNGIVLIDYINQLRQSGMNKKEAIIEAGTTRLRPILMTALTTILGLLTLALGIGSGSEMLQPLGIVTIGGLAYATILTLFVVPCMYDMMHREKKKSKHHAKRTPKH